MERESRPGAIVSLLILAAGVTLALLAMLPPPPRPTSPAEFSAERAMGDVRMIATTPHPPSTAAHDRIRDYILGRFRALGYETRLQKTVAVRDFDYFCKVATVENIVAYRAGHGDRNRLLLLAAHYDSHHTGPGAGDDAAGVATLLEVARAQRETNARSDNDLAFLVTDAEEQGLLGARAFVDEAATFWDGRFDPHKRDIIALNFEGRGAAGPVFMFETSDGNEGLIAALGKALRPVATSLMFALYKTLPNDTDLTAFKRAGMRGMNFAFADRWAHYHTALDTPEGLDASSLQHHGEYALALVRQFAVHWPESEAGDAIYFDLFGRWLVHYPGTFRWPLTALALAIFILAFLPSRKERGALASFFAGLFAFPITLVVGGALAFGFGRLLEPIGAATPYHDTYAPRWFEASLLLLVTGVLYGVWLPILRRTVTSLVTLGALFWWLLALVAATIYLPGATYLFCWPLLFSLLGALRSRPPIALAVLCALPLVVLYPPIVHGIALMLGFGKPVVLGVLLAFGFAPLLPAVRCTTSLSYWPAAMIALAGALCFPLGIYLSRGPHTDSLIYAFDTDAKAGYWLTRDAKDDSWQAPILKGANTEMDGRFFYPWMKDRFRVADAPLLSPSPLKATRSGNTLTLTSDHPLAEVIVATDQPVRNAVVFNRTVSGVEKPLCLRLLAPPTTITVRLDAPAGTTVTIVDYTYGLPSTVPPRPPEYIAAPIDPFTDMTLTRRTTRW